MDPDEIQTLPPTPTCAQPQIAPIVLVQLPNCLPFASAVLGTLTAGLTATLASPMLTSKEIAWVLQNSRPRVIITATACLSAMRDAIAAQEDKAYFAHVPVYTVDVANEAYPSLQSTTSELQSDWKRLLASPSTGVKQPSYFDAPSRTAVILWSSGTSGRSKGVLLSHHALNFSVASLWHDADYYQGQQQRWLGFVPFFHVYGLLNLFFLAIPTGATVYIMQAFKLDSMLAAIPRRKITYLHMAPPIAVILAKSPAVEPYARRDAQGRNQFDSVVAGMTGGAPLGHDIVSQVYSRLGFRIRLGYGLTEACSVTLQRGLSEREMQDHGDNTGTPHWGVQLMIAGRDGASTKSVALGEPGEVLIRSQGLMMGYLPLGALNSEGKLDMTPTTEALTSDGWFRTGDVGSLDANGALRLSDRIKELIKVRGFQVPPAELEAILCSSNEVGDAGVVAVYDEGEATEWPRAFVVAANARLVEADLRALAGRLRELVERQTARYKWLRGGIVFVDKVPKSPSGKILRRVMRDGVVKGLEVAVYEPMARGAKL